MYLTRKKKHVFNILRIKSEFCEKHISFHKIIYYYIIFHVVCLYFSFTTYCLIITYKTLWIALCVMRNILYCTFRPDTCFSPDMKLTFGAKVELNLVSCRQQMVEGEKGWRRKIKSPAACLPSLGAGRGWWEMWS